MSVHYTAGLSTESNDRPAETTAIEGDPYR